MVRDMELYRNILLAVEANPAGQIWHAQPLLEYPLEVVVGHIRLLEDAGLVVARFLGEIDNSDGCILRITNDGYEFLEASKIPTLWEKSIARIKSAGGPLTLEVLKVVLSGMAKELLK